MLAALALAADADPSWFETLGLSGERVGGGLIAYILTAIGLWRVFAKAGWPSWYALIPILNLYATIKIAGMRGWWILLYLVPVANLVIAIVVAVALGERFGKGGAFSFFLLFMLAPIGYLILGFGSAQYRGTAELHRATA